ncbi:MAG: TIR domain-containing protein [Acidobacteriota bacterium]
MSSDRVFISHASKDDAFVTELRLALEGQGITVWVDSRNLRGGAKLAPEIDEAIEHARQVIVVLSPNTVNSPWVRKEITKAVEVENQRKDEGFRVIPLLLPGIEPSALALWFDEEPVGVRVEIKTGGLSEAMPAILAALGEQLPADFQPIKKTVQQPVEELILKLTDMKIHEESGKRRARATATLIFEPADKSARAVESKRFTFNAPLGAIEADDLRWYLEEYYIWPIGVFEERAKRIEAQLPVWGQDLYQSALGPQVAQEALNAWLQAGADGERRFSVFVDSELPEGAGDPEQAVAREAASELLSLPWELLHDGRGFLFHGKHPVLVRRRLPNRHPMEVRPTRLPIRILLVSPRPEEENRFGYIDHRISARPLIEAVEGLGELVTVTVLTPPTFPALEEALQKAGEVTQPFDVVHFDGHGVYDQGHGLHGLGALCFEDPNEMEKLELRKVQLVHAEKLAEVIRDHRIPLIFLEACQSAKSEDDPTASVAAKLLEEGVTSIVAMSHSVLVETAHRFVGAFYQELASGKRIGAAMIAGQRELHRDANRGRVMGAGELHLQDWFVPVLYQEEQDPQLITELLPKEVQQLQASQRRLSLGELPDLPHEFQGRSRELLALERLLHRVPYAVIRGQGGAGKTALAAELARWLVRTGRFRRAAFVSLEQYTDARGVLDSIGRQLLPEGDKYSVSQYPDLKQALQPVERALRDRATIIVLDNLESVLPNQTFVVPPSGGDSSSEEKGPPEGGTTNEALDEIFSLCRTLLDADPATRIVFTSRESLPAPFDKKLCERRLGPLDRGDAIKLVAEVMKQEGLTPKSDDPGSDPQEIIELVEAVNCHARALVTLAREVSHSGVRATTENLHQLMAELHRKHPDDRENSLYASVELSLRRLPAELREQSRVLGVFHGGAHLMVLNYVLGRAADDVETVQKLAAALIEVGLAEAMPYGHLRLDPALPGYLLGQMSAAEQEQAHLRWEKVMRGLTGLLVEQQSQDAQLAAQLTLLELPNLLSLLAWAKGALTPEEVVSLAGNLESLLSKLGRPQAMVQATKAREQAAQRLGEWSHAQFDSLGQDIERMLEQSRLPEAHAAAEQLLQRALAAGEAAYAGAAYDIAMAQWQFGRVLKKIGAAEAALSPLREAQQRFQALVDAGDATAEQMAAAAFSETADCLRDLGRYDEATIAYEERIRRAERLGDRRGEAVGKAQLGTVRLCQKRYGEALESYREALKIFDSLGEPRSVATAWHQIGMAHKNAGQFDQAEQAYRQGLAIWVQQRDRAREASTLGELGTLHDQMGRLEEAANFYRQAADIDVQLQDKRNEGIHRSNLANALIKLERYDEARGELYRAIRCKQPFGHAAEPWKTWDILHDLEQATGNAQAAEAARGQAITSYLAYRRAGGASQSNVAELYDIVGQAIQQGAMTEAEHYLDEWSAEDDPLWAKALAAGLRSILRGARDPALAADPNLDYRTAAELQLLLEALDAK